MADKKVCINCTNVTHDYYIYNPETNRKIKYGVLCQRCYELISNRSIRLIMSSKKDDDWYAEFNSNGLQSSDYI